MIFLICVVIDCDPYGDITRLHSVNQRQHFVGFFSFSLKAFLGV